MSECRIPEILIVDKIRGAEIYKRWIQSYEIYENARELENKSEKSQVGKFLNTIGSDGVDIYIYNSFEDETIEVTIDKKKSSGKKNLEWIKEKFKAYFIPKRNLTYERYVFCKRDQFESEKNSKSTFQSLGNIRLRLISIQATKIHYSGGLLFPIY